MTIDDKINNFKRAIQLNKPKNFVQFKFIQYMREYDKLEDIDVKIKLQHRELFEKYCEYMRKDDNHKIYKIVF